MIQSMHAEYNKWCFNCVLFSAFQPSHESVMLLNAQVVLFICLQSLDVLPCFINTAVLVFV